MNGKRGIDSGKRTSLLTYPTIIHRFYATRSRSRRTLRGFPR
jgi:hypothetical protein